VRSALLFPGSLRVLPGALVGEAILAEGGLSSTAVVLMNGAGKAQFGTVMKLTYN